MLIRRRGGAIGAIAEGNTGIGNKDIDRTQFLFGLVHRSHDFLFL